MDSVNKKVFVALRLIILAVSIVILLNIVDFKLVVSYVSTINSYVLFVLVIISFIHTWLTGLRWRLLNPDTSGQLSRWQYFRFLMISKAFNLIMPGALGGDFIRGAITVSTVQGKKAENIIAILVDRFIGLLSIMLLGTVAFLFNNDIPDRTAFYSIFLVIYLIAVITVVVFTNRVSFLVVEKITLHLGKLGIFIRKAMEIWKQVLLYFKANRNKVYGAILICIPIHMISFITTYIIALTIGIQISFLSISLILTLVWLITAVPLTISGAGIRELSFIYFLSIYGVGSEQAMALSIYKYILMLLVGLIGFMFVIDWVELGKRITVRLGF